MSSVTPSCVSCSKVDNLKRCAKCHTTQYCSRDCQKKDWNAHKKVCAQYAANNTSASSTSATPPSAEPPKSLTVRIEKPFYELSTNTWLDNCPEHDVHKLLIDCFRLRQDDNYKFEGDAKTDSIYAGSLKQHAWLSKIHSARNGTYWALAFVVVTGKGARVRGSRVKRWVEFVVTCGREDRYCRTLCGLDDAYAVEDAGGRGI